MSNICLKSIFMSNTNIKTNEEFRAMLIRRRRIFWGIAVLGLITMAVGIVAEFFMETQLNDHTLGLIAGIGFGLLIGCAVVQLRTAAMLKDEDKLRTERLKYTDERLVEISNRALKVATLALLAALYLIGLVGAMFQPLLLSLLVAQVAVFLLAFLIAQGIYSRKM